MQMTYKAFYKVIVLKVDIFESNIVDERHFPTNNEANLYAENMREVGYLPVIVSI